jgi:HEAT repeat protein
MGLFGRGKPNAHTLVFSGGFRTAPATSAASQNGRVEKGNPNVQALAEREDVEALVDAATFQDLLPGRDGSTVDRGAVVREQAVLALGALGPDAGNGIVQGALADPSDRVRVAAVRVLHAREEAEPLAEALAWLPAGSGHSRRLTLHALAELARPASARALAAALVHARGNDPVEDDDTALLVRLVEAEDSADAGNEVIEELLSSLADEREVVADRAEELLVELAPASIGGVISELRSGTAPHRAAAVLGRIKDARAMDSLVEALAHRDAQVRAESAAALGELRDPAAVHPLLRATRDPDHTVRARAGWALDLMGTVAVVVGVSHLVRPMVQEAVVSAVEGQPALTESTPAPPGGEDQEEAEPPPEGERPDLTTLHRLAGLHDRIEDARAGHEPPAK